MKTIAGNTAAIVVGAALAVSFMTSAQAESRRAYSDRQARDYANQQVAGNTVGGAANGSAQWNDAYGWSFNNCMQGY